MAGLQKSLVSLVLLLLAVGFSSAMAAGPTEKNGDSLWVFIGTYTKSPAAGVNFCKLDLPSGSLSQPEVAAKMVNPSFLAVHPCRPVLYAIGEVAHTGKVKEGFVRAYAIQPKTARLDLINQETTGGPGPCHASLDATAQALLVANYDGGSVACLPIQPDGSLQPAVSIDQHHGSSVNRQRQTGPFAHCITADPSNQFALSADLGTDKVMIYRFDAAARTLKPSTPAFAQMAAGSGPRHVVFHPPKGKFVYVINELNSTISAFGFDPTEGKLAGIQDISTLPESFHGPNTAAEIAIHPSGRYLYASNRGHNSIAVFAVDQESGRLRSLGHQSTQGKTPRHFAIDPTGHYLLAADQDSDRVVVFRIDQDNGTLRPTGHVVSVPSPTCVVMLRPVE